MVKESRPAAATTTSTSLPLCFSPSERSFICPTFQARPQRPGFFPLKRVPSRGLKDVVQEDRGQSVLFFVGAGREIWSRASIYGYTRHIRLEDRRPQFERRNCGTLYAIEAVASLVILIKTLRHHYIERGLPLCSYTFRAFLQLSFL